MPMMIARSGVIAVKMQPPSALQNGRSRRRPRHFSDAPRLHPLNKTAGSFGEVLKTPSLPPVRKMMAAAAESKNKKPQQSQRPTHCQPRKAMNSFHLPALSYGYFDSKDGYAKPSSPPFEAQTYKSRFVMPEPPAPTSIPGLMSKWEQNKKRKDSQKRQAVPALFSVMGSVVVEDF